MLETILMYAFQVVAILFMAMPLMLIGGGLIFAINSGFFGDGHLVMTALGAVLLGFVWLGICRLTLNHPK